MHASDSRKRRNAPRAKVLKATHPSRRIRAAAWISNLRRPARSELLAELVARSLEGRRPPPDDVRRSPGFALVASLRGRSRRMSPHGDRAPPPCRRVRSPGHHGRGRARMGQRRDANGFARVENLGAVEVRGEPADMASSRGRTRVQRTASTLSARHRYEPRERGGHRNQPHRSMVPFVETSSP